MTYREAIETIKVAKAEVEWEHPMDYYVAFDLAIEALKQESVLENIKADLEKLANDEWNTKVGSVSQGLECALEIIEAYQEGR